ncbi:hypothetical protein [Arthrobacter oryzae]|jgi:hypothetical protein|uniref:hypothetical protein n=1 Tax=Arthrobacter oryzae TaxID=409290 RepID=UPI002856DA76|nr:hypothetical protein [Arthrobacter oryzae]MDR6508858.1 hypothetical protein [Arthrobacter oryzae]
MLKKIAAAAALAGALAFSAAAPAVLSAGPVGNWVDQLGSTSTTAIGNWPDPMQAIGNWPDPMSFQASIGNWPDPM